jgi:hypothetical protein
MKIQKIILLVAPVFLGLGLIGPVLTPAQAEPEKKTDPKPATKKLTGAELYAINCNRCHPERYATEFTTAQWQTIMLHMRVRANLPAAQAREILKFLKEDAGN